MCLATYGASVAVNLCRYVEKSTKCSELKCANSFREKISCSLIACVQVLSDLHNMYIFAM